MHHLEVASIEHLWGLRQQFDKAGRTNHTKGAYWFEIGPERGVRHTGYLEDKQV
jgi:hypothetical protein